MQSIYTQSSMFSTSTSSLTFPKNSIPPTQLKAIADFIGASVEVLNTLSDSQINGKLIYAFENSDLTGQPELELTNFRFNVPFRETCKVSGNVRLTHCEILSGTIEFSNGDVMAIGTHVAAIACGEKATATSIGGACVYASHKGAKAYADDINSVAIANATGAKSYSLHNNARAWAMKPGAVAHAKRGTAFAEEGGIARAIGFHTKAYAQDSSSEAYAEHDRSDAVATNGGVAIAKERGATAEAYGISAKAFATVPDSTAIADKGATASALAEGATSRAYGNDSYAYASCSGARAEAYDSSTAVKLTVGAIAMAIGGTAKVVDKTRVIGKQGLDKKPVEEDMQLTKKSIRRKEDSPSVESIHLGWKGQADEGNRYITNDDLE